MSKKKKTALRGEKNEFSQKYIEAPYPHFRKYRKSGHPALLIGEDINNSNRVVYRRTSHEHNFGKGKAYDTVSPNPKPYDPRPMYIEKKKRVDEKKNFASRPYPWKFKK